MAPAHQCKLVYNAHLRDDIVIPAVKKIEGKYYSNWDYQKPGLYEHDGKLEVILSMSDDYLDPPGFIVVLNLCTLDVLDAYETDAWFNDIRKKRK